MLQYIEERRQESAVLYGGVQEMMNELAFVAWMGKAKNGSMNPVEASTLFKKKCSEPGAIVDEKGNHEKFRTRVAVLKADLVTSRDASIHAQGYVGKDKEIRKGSQADVDRLEARLGKESVMQASSARTRNDMASAMVSAAASAASSGTGAGAFSNEGISAMHLGNNVKDLLSDSEHEDDQGTTDRSDPSTPAKASNSAAADEDSPEQPSSNKKPKKIWWDRDASISACIKSHASWLKATKTTLTGTVEKLKGTIGKVTADIEDEVRNEARLARNRLYALRLVLGEPVKVEEPEADEEEPKVVEGSQDAQKLAESTEKVDEGAEANPPKTEDAAANPEAKNSADPAVSKEGQPKASPKASAAASTLMNFRLAAGGDPEKALRKYIASFAGDEKKVLGQAPPCRSYQALVLFQTFEDKTEAFEKCESKDEITRVQNDMKPFKAAYQDLLSMAKAAEKRLGTSIADALKQKEQAKVDAIEPKAKRGRPSKKQAGQPAAAAGPMVDQPQDCAQDIPSIVMHASRWRPVGEPRR